jgi:phosphoribosylformylglycinamidine cyclo-ligase
MYSVFNMGHRIEIICETSAAEEIIKISEGFSVAAKRIGHVEASTSENSVVLRSEYGEFRYGS